MNLSISTVLEIKNPTKKLVDFVIAHRFIIVNAAIMAWLVVSPQLLFPFMSGQSYRGVNIGNFGDDDIGYYSKGQEILEGHGLGNLTLKIGKGAPDPHGVYGEYLLLMPVKLLGLANHVNIVNLYTVYQALGIFFLILLIYFFVCRLTADKMLAAVTSVFVIGGYNFVIRWPIKNAIFNTDLNIYSRPVIPYLSSIAFFIFLLALTKSLKSREWKHHLLAGLTFGSLFYVYPYAWSFALAVIGSLLFLSILKRDKILIKKFAAVFVVGLLIGAYELMQVFLFSHSAMGKQSAFFAGIQTDHQLAPFSKLSFGVLLLFGVFAYKRKEDENRLFLLALLLAGWAALNQQIITGKSVQILHYFWYFVIPLNIIVGFICLGVLTANDKYKKYQMAVLIVLLIMAQARTIVQQVTGTRATFGFKQNAQNYGPIIDALNRDKQPGVILFSDKFYGSMFTVYTHHDLFWSRNVYVFNTPIKRLKDALYVYAYLNKESRQNFAKYLTNDTPKWHEPVENSRDIYNSLEGYLSGTGDAGEYSERLGMRDPLILKKNQETLLLLEQEFKKLAADPANIADILKQDEVNYIVWDKNQNPEWDLSFIKGLTEVASNNNIYLYKF